MPEIKFPGAQRLLQIAFFVRPTLLKSEKCSVYKSARQFENVILKSQKLERLPQQLPTIIYFQIKRSVHQLMITGMILFFLFATANFFSACQTNISVPVTESTVTIYDPAINSCVCSRVHINPTNIMLRWSVNKANRCSVFLNNIWS